MSILKRLLKEYIRVANLIIGDPKILLAFLGVTISIVASVFSLGSFDETKFEITIKFWYPLIVAIVFLAIVMTKILRVENERLSKKPTVFISYHHNDTKFVEKLKEDLSTSGAIVLSDKLNFEVGDNINRKISDLISASDFVLYINSESSSESKWLGIELEKARKYSKKVLPIVIEGASVPELLKDIFYADFESSYDDGLEQVLQSMKIGKRVLTKQ